MLTGVLAPAVISPKSPDAISCLKIEYVQAAITRKLRKCGQLLIVRDRDLQRVVAETTFSRAIRAELDGC